MAQQNINVGTSANDGTGDTLRDSQIKANSNFTELYTNKVDKVLGKGLSENDYTNAEQTKLAGIETGAEVNVQADFAQTDSLADDYIKNKPASLYASIGFFDYNDLNTQTSPLVLTAGVPYKITNDTLGAFTNITNAPYGVSSIWDAVNNAFDFSELSIGDTIDIRTDLEITTIGSNENVKMFFRLAAGSPSEYDLYFYDKNFKSAGVNVIQDFTSIYIGSQDYIDYPTEFYIVGDNGGSVQVNGWYTRILLKDVNIVSFSDPTKKIKLESNKYNDLLLSGSDALIDLQPDGSSYYEFSNAGLVSLKGFDFTSLDLAPSGEYPYEGKDFVLKNSTGSDITLKENILLGTQIPFKLSGGVDATMPDGGLIWFKVVNGIVEAEEIMRSWTSGGGGGGDSEGYNPNGYLIPKYYVHNWTQAGEHPFNLVHPTNAGNSRTRMEAASLGSTYYIHFFFPEPVLITEMYYCNGSIAINDGSIEQFKLLGSTSVKSNLYALTLHDSTVGDSVMEESNHTTDFFEPFKKIILANPLSVASLRFEAHTIYPGGSTRPRIQKILFK